jgi:hypothetical protein
VDPKVAIAFAHFAAATGKGCYRTAAEDILRAISTWLLTLVTAGCSLVSCWFQGTPAGNHRKPTENHGLEHDLPADKTR